MESKELVKYWVESSDRDYESMIKNYESKQYTWALFIGHLVLEKLLKGIYAKINMLIALVLPEQLKMVEIVFVTINAL